MPGDPGLQDRGHFLHLLPLSCTTLPAVHSLSLIGTLHFDMLLPCFGDILFSAHSFSLSCVSPRVAATRVPHCSSISTYAANGVLCRKETKNRRYVEVSERGANHCLFDTCIECMNAPAANLCDSQKTHRRDCAPPSQHDPSRSIARQRGQAGYRRRLLGKMASAA